MIYFAVSEFKELSPRYARATFLPRSHEGHEEKIKIELYLSTSCSSCLRGDNLLIFLWLLEFRSSKLATKVLRNN